MLLSTYTCYYRYYKNYCCLLKDLGIKAATVSAKYLLHTNDNPERESQYVGETH